MSADTPGAAATLADEMARRRGRRYPAHAFIAEKFPDMVCVNPCGAKVLTFGVTCMLEAMDELKAEGWQAPA